MEKDMIFFSPEGKGLTSTSANHIANLAKEMIREIETSLKEMKFYSTSVSLIGGERPNILSKGSTEEDACSVIDKLHSVAEAKSLIAWLREAIKSKERMIAEIGNLTLKDYALKKGIQLTEMPEIGELLTEDEYWASKQVGERCRYYSLETLAATLGSAIHPGGGFATARDELMKKSNRPHSVEGKGRDTLIYSYQPTVSETKVEEIYFRLQAQYRDVQSRLNAMKHECKKAVEDSAIEARTAYSKKLEEWSNSRKVLEAEKSEYIQRRTKEIGKLRIIIPESLTVIFEKVTNLGK